MTAPHPMLGMNEWSGFARVTRANIERKQRNLARVETLSLFGATVAAIAQDLGLSEIYVRDLRTKLRREGRLGCCMSLGCTNKAEGQDYSSCKWFVK